MFRWLDSQKTSSMYHFATKSCATNVLQPNHLSWTYSIALNCELIHPLKLFCNPISIEAILRDCNNFTFMSVQYTYLVVEVVYYPFSIESDHCES